jgi:hypothetical protein
MRWRTVVFVGVVLAAAGCAKPVPATATVTGTATSSLINDGKSQCSRPLTARLQADKTAAVTLICDIR